MVVPGEVSLVGYQPRTLCHLAMSAAVAPTGGRSHKPPVDTLWVRLVGAKDAYDNVTEELFVLTLLLLRLQPCRVKVSMQHLHPIAGGGGDRISQCEAPDSPPPPPLPSLTATVLCERCRGWTRNWRMNKKKG